MFRPARIRHYVAVMRLHGFDAPTVLAGSCIPAHRLEDPSYLVSPDQYRKVVANILRLTGNKGIAFDLGSRSEIADLGIVGYAMVSSPTLLDALQLWIRYARALVGACWGVRLLDDEPGHFSVEVIEELPTAGGLAFCVEEFITMMQKIGGALSGAAPEVQRVMLPYEKPDYADLYDEICKVPVRFSAQRMQITVPQSWADTPLRTSDREFNEICLQHCGQIMRQIAQESPLLSRLRLMLLRSPSAVPTLDEAAEHLGLSSRTLRRQLHDQGRSYHRLVADFRTELACEYLRSATLSAKEIGYLLGFESSNAFRRAFKTWTGSTLREYRDSLGVAAPAFDSDDAD